MGELWSASIVIRYLIGLILMLKDMNDASTIGPKMAVALVTTLYGSLIANWLCNPTASKLSVNNNKRYDEGNHGGRYSCRFTGRRESTCHRRKLKSFLSPSAREETVRAVSEVRNSGEKERKITQRLTCMDEYLRGPYESCSVSS